MTPQSSGRRPRRSRGGSRRRGDRDRNPRYQETRAAKPPQKTFWQRVVAFFNGNGQPAKKPTTPSRNGSRPPQPSQTAQPATQQERPTRKPESVEVTSPRLYVGNLSFDAAESDLFELFNGVGHVENAEVVTYRHNQRSKGFAFVQMQTVDEAKRAVTELHDKEFLGRKLVVSGAKTSEHQPRE